MKSSNALLVVALLCVTAPGLAQQNYYDVTAGNGYGLRFWSADAYKIHMGIGTEYSYGPVTDYSIKTNMSTTTGRGWTWGTSGQAPVAALGNQGNMRIAGSFQALDAKMEGILLDRTAWPYLIFSESGTPGARIQGVNGLFAVTSLNGATNHFTVNSSSGNVGIGTTTPDAKLTVKGQIHAQEVKVDLSGAIAPDYVFEKNYKLPSLESIQTYINQNKHLPDVPSGKEMEANGVNLGEMNMLLLKKIEELTLYMIELKNDNEQLREEMKKIKDKIK